MRNEHLFVFGHVLRLPDRGAAKRHGSPIEHHAGMGLSGFEQGRYAIGEASYFVAQGGDGRPVVLLHGFPETHLCWREVAPRLSRRHRVVVPDLRGYGETRAPAGGPRGEGYSKREMAAEIVELMAACGHDRFAVVGHDRGARVAFRLALDHPERVTRAALLNIVPTVDQFERMAAGPSLGYWPWFLLAQPAPFPERIICADPGAVLGHIFATWSSRPEAISPENRDAPDVWRAWTEDLTAGQVPGGHFIPEEAAEELAGVLGGFLERADAAA